MSAPRILIAPDPEPEIVDAVRRGGGEPVDEAGNAEALVWLGGVGEGLRAALAPGMRWVQVRGAGVEGWLEAGVVDEGRTWTSAADAYSHAVAEHVVALALAAFRQLPQCARTDRWRHAELQGRSLRGATVAIVGAGGIGRALIALLAPFGVRVLAVNRSGRPVPGAERTLTAERVDEVWGEADVVVLAAPATAATRHLVDGHALRAMRPTAWLINVARGSLVDTDALVAALDAGQIAGAALDVTDPEPLPDGHPLFGHPRAIVTPHVANPSAELLPALAQRVTENVARFADGRELVGVIDVRRGY